VDVSNDLPWISRRALSLHNGSDRPEIWIAYQGLVYDASASRLWRAGLHYGLHWAGQDLTSELAAAPHNELVFSRLPIVGRLEAEG
jgi:predicted heme/steroid binding protein